MTQLDTDTTSRRRLLTTIAGGAALGLAGCLGSSGGDGTPTSTPGTPVGSGSQPRDGFGEDTWFYNYGFVSVGDRYSLDYRDLGSGEGDASMVLEVLGWEGNEATGHPKVRIDSTDGEELYVGGMDRLFGVATAEAFDYVRAAMNGVRLTYAIFDGTFGQSEHESFAPTVGETWKNSSDRYEVVGETTVMGDPGFLVNHSYEIGDDDPMLVEELTVHPQFPFVSRALVYVEDFEPSEEPVEELVVERL